MITRNDQQKAQKRLAFTLMEILVVVAIIVALAGVGGFFLIGQLRTSQGDVAKMQARELEKACKTFFIRYQRWPQGLEELYNTPNGVPVLEDQKAVFDPWGQPYQMQQGPLGQPMIVSVGSGTPISSKD